MTAARFVLVTDRVRANAIEAIRSAKDGSRVEIRGPRRTLDQNARFWAMLTDISSQSEHCGRKYEPETWKAIMLHALGHETQFVPSLDGQEIIPVGYSSSNLSVAQMTDMMELMMSWGIEHGVRFKDPDASPDPVPLEGETT